MPCDRIIWESKDEWNAGQAFSSMCDTSFTRGLQGISDLSSFKWGQEVAQAT